jgi:hypothetical protein
VSQKKLPMRGTKAETRMEKNQGGKSAPNPSLKSGKNPLKYKENPLGLFPKTVIIA